MKPYLFVMYKGGKMEHNKIEMNGKKISLSRLSNEELVKLYQEIRMQEDKLEKIIEKYQEKYPFLKE